MPYSITITATDPVDTQLVDSQVLEFTVFNNVAIVGGPYSGAANNAIRLDASESVRS